MYCFCSSLILVPDGQADPDAAGTPVGGGCSGEGLVGSSGEPRVCPITIRPIYLILVRFVVPSPPIASSATPFLVRQVAAFALYNHGICWSRRGVGGPSALTTLFDYSTM